MKKLTTVMLTGFLLALTLLSNGQSNNLPHLRKTGNVTHYMVNNKPFLMLAGELHNSSMGGFAYMRPIWKRMADANLNTVIASASWELVEPVEGKYDFALVDSIAACFPDSTSAPPSDQIIIQKITPLPFHSKWFLPPTQLDSDSSKLHSRFLILYPQPKRLDFYDRIHSYRYQNFLQRKGKYQV